MTDTCTEVTEQGWLSRIGGSIKGVFVGIILVLAAMALLFWNEHRAVVTARSLEEGAANVVTVPATEINPEHDGQLVHITAEATTNEMLRDAEFDIRVSGIKLERIVEMYQWKETSHRREEKKVGGGTRTVTEYTYEKVWSATLTNSSSFKDQTGHVNPQSMRFTGMTRRASNVALGAFMLSQSLIGRIEEYQPYQVGQADLNRLAPALQRDMQTYQGGLYMRHDPNRPFSPGTPDIGDLKISFRFVPQPLMVSIVAKQSGGTFEPYPTEAGRDLEMLEPGVMSSDRMFAKAEQENTILTWVLRGVGWLLMFIGFAMIFKPLSVVADVIPLIGSIVGMGAVLLSLIISVPLSLIIIAVAWITFRPVLATIILVLAGIVIAGGIFVAVTVIRKKKAKAQFATTMSRVAAHIGDGSEEPKPE